MGTRADFYVGRGPQAEWLGSVAWDGYPEGIPDDVKQANTEDGYRSAVNAFFERDKAYKAEAGWPWPWKDSSTTDYAYAFDGTHVRAACFGRGWWTAIDPKPVDSDRLPEVDFPDMRLLEDCSE